MSSATTLYSGEVVIDSKSGPVSDILNDYYKKYDHIVIPEKICQDDFELQKKELLNDYYSDLER